MQNKPKQRGGKRPNSGRKPHNIETTTWAVRTRVEWMDELKQIVRDFKMRKKNENN